MARVLHALAAAVIAALFIAAPAAAQDKVRIGFITTLSGPQGVIGKHMRDSVELALDHLGHRMGARPVEVLYGDDQMKPDIGVPQAAGTWPTFARNMAIRLQTMARKATTPSC